MKTLTRTMIVLICVHLIVASSTFAGNISDEPTPDSTNVQAPQAGVAQTQSNYDTRKITVPAISTGRNILLGTQFDGSIPVLVIPSAEITTEEIATISEDMNIMSRILERNLDQVHIDVGSMFIPSSDPFNIVFKRNKQSSQGMYLQGYGAIFLMKVDFPLSPPPQVEEKKETEKKEDVDPVWTQTKKEIYEPEESRRHKSDHPAKEYDAKEVENLKTTLVKSLKHAANIRNLKSDESVILTVTGSGAPSDVKGVVVGQKQTIIVDQKFGTRAIQGRFPDNTFSLPTILVIRAKKADIDRFAKGDTDYDQFLQNTQILSCAYLTDQSTVNPLNSGF